MLAGAVSKDDPDAVRASLNFILYKAHCGEVRGRYPSTLVPFDTARISPADYANRLVLTPNDLHRLASECDLRVEVDDVLKAAHPTQPEPAPAQNAATPAWVVDSASDATAWAVTKPQRYRGYAAPLHRLLAAAHHDGKRRPTARDVVEAWRIKQPPEIAQVLPDGFDYYDGKGNIKPADLDAIRKAIGRMTGVR